MNAIVREIVSEREVRVALLRQTECKNCDKCGICSAQGPGTELLATASNPVGARAGDIVEVESAAGSPIKLALIVYALPCVFLVLGYLLGQALQWSEMVSVGLAGLGAVAGFLPAVALNRHVAGKRGPEFVIQSRVL